MKKDTDIVLDLLNRSYSQFHVVSEIKEILLKNDYIQLDEKKAFNLKKGKNYFVTRNDSSIIAFKISEKASTSFKVSAAHSDSPTFKLKPNPVIIKNDLVLLNVEPYGGMIMSSFIDRPLSISGRVILKNRNTLKPVLFSSKSKVIIPNLAIHMNRNINSGYEYNPAVDMLPILTQIKENNFNFNEFIQKELKTKDEVISFDLFLSQEKEGNNSKYVGMNDEFISSGKLDDLSSAYTSLLGFIKAKSSSSIDVLTIFDNEEVGSLTRQGANSTFLKDTLKRISDDIFKEKDSYERAVSNGFMLSIDNGHANHPNHLQMSDQNSNVKLNGGIVLKHNAQQKYTSDGLSSSIIKEIAKKADIPVQEYTNRSDLKGGSTLGNISNSEVSFLSADIGLAQLAMHSFNEMCGSKDISNMTNFTKTYFESDIIFKDDTIQIK